MMGLFFVELLHNGFAGEQPATQARSASSIPALSFLGALQSCYSPCIGHGGTGEGGGEVWLT